MNKLSIQSTGTINPKNIEEGYRRISEAGFECVDFNFDEYLSCVDVDAGRINQIFDRPIEEIWEDFKPHAHMAAKYGLTFEQMHAPFPIMKKGDEELSEKMLRITENCLEICARMGGHYIVVHPVTLAYQYSKKEEHDFNIAMYQKLIPTARRLKLVLCLENMFIDHRQHLMEGCCSDFAEAAAMIDELNKLAGEELFGFCFDVGHANILGKNLYQAVVTLGDRLKILHVHDNDGISDLHTMPFVFARSWNPSGTDWQGFIRGLSEIGYKGPINFETFRCMQSFPEELHPQLLSLFSGMGKYFAKQI